MAKFSEKSLHAHMRTLQRALQNLDEKYPSMWISRFGFTNNGAANKKWRSEITHIALTTLISQGKIEQSEVQRYKPDLKPDSRETEEVIRIARTDSETPHDNTPQPIYYPRGHTFHHTHDSKAIPQPKYKSDIDMYRRMNDITKQLQSIDSQYPEIWTLAAHMHLPAGKTTTAAFKALKQERTIETNVAQIRTDITKKDKRYQRKIVRITPPSTTHTPIIHTLNKLINQHKTNTTTNTWSRTTITVTEHTTILAIYNPYSHTIIPTILGATTPKDPT